MPSVLRPSLALAVVPLLLGAGCATTTPDAQTVVTDSAYVAGTVEGGDLVASKALTLSGAAVWHDVTVAEWRTLAQVDPDADLPGGYAGDTVPVVRLQPGAGPGHASVEAGVDVGTAFESEVLFRLDPAGGALDLVFEGEGAGGGRAMPSRLGVRLQSSPSGDGDGIFVTLGSGVGAPSALADAPLPEGFAPGALAHRLSVRYTPGAVSVFLDGAPAVTDAVARLGGGPMTASVTANTAGEARAHLLQWHLDADEQ